MNSASSVRGMILAAGYGTRLAPVTDHAPKPLLPVGGEPLLGRILRSLDTAGIGEVAVNTHHLGGQVEAWLRARPDAERFAIFPETEILGTGGALDGARSFLEQSEAFLLHNGDVLCDVDLSGLLAEHAAHGALATLLLVDWPAVNSVEMTGDGTVARIAGMPKTAAGAQRKLTYSGVGVFDSRLLADIGPGFSSLIDPLVRAMEAEPGCVRGWAPEGVRWSDLGTLPRWLEAQPEAVETDGDSPVRLERITGHGSDRRFWRISTDGWSAVAMQSPSQDEEFERQVSIGRWLHEGGFGAPEMLAVHEEEQVLLCEDLGSERLYEVARRDPAAAGPVCEEALDLLVRLQRATARAQAECPSATDRRLDESVLRWETDYFRERFLVGHRGGDAATLSSLDADFAALARAVERQPAVLIHRDFQSQNIHLTAGGIRLVDFQGMRLGPLGYDAAALIFDPYVDLGEAVRARLLAHFCRVAGTAHGLSESDVRAMVLAAGLQRLMQALGAYGFLGGVKGKTEFLDHIPAGAARLREIFTATGAADANPWLPPAMPVLAAVLDDLS